MTTRGGRTKAGQRHEKEDRCSGGRSRPPDPTENLFAEQKTQKQSAHQGKSITRNIARHQTPFVFSRWPPPAAVAAAGPTRRPPLPPLASYRLRRRPLTVASSSVCCKTLLSSPAGEPPPHAPMRHRGR
jgi:hypothetical protein